MLFSKQFIAEKFDLMLNKKFYEIHPYKTYFKEGEKSNFELFLLNYYTFFDLESENMKNKKYESNKKISDNCFKDEFMDVFPYIEKIDQCITNTELSYLGKYNQKREEFFGNVFANYNQTLNNCPTRDLKCIQDAYERFGWDVIKSKYFFKEKLFEI